MTTTADNWQAIDPDEINTRLLPPQMRNIIKIIGLPATMALYEHRGGAPIEFPSSYPERSALVAVIGLPAVQAITRSPWAGKRTTLSKPDKAHWELKRIYARSQKGKKTKREIAGELRCTTRWVQYIWNEQPAEDPTGDLFEASGL